MKRIIAIILAALMTVALLTACGEEDAKTRTATETQKATEAPTEATAAPTEAPTEAPTDAPTEAPTEAPTKAPAQETDFLYNDPSGLYQLTVPVIWNATGLIVEDEYQGHEAVKFVYQDAYYQGAGRVFTVIYIDDPADFVDVTQWPHAEELFNNGSIQVFVDYPTDVQWGVYEQPGTSEFNKQQAEYNALKDTTRSILDSFTICDI